MKEERSRQPKIRVVDEDSSAGEVVRLGGEEPIVRLGDGRAEPAEPAEPVVARRLEVGTGKQVEARQATVDEILEPIEGTGSPEGPLEEGWGGESKRWLVVPWGWFVVILLICVGFAGWSLRHMFEHRHVTQLAVSRTIELVETSMQSEQEARRLYDRVEERISSYLASRTVEERVRHVRQAERVAPLMREWYAQHPLEGQRFEEMVTFQPLTIEQRPFWMVRVRTDSGMHPLLLEQTGDDGVLVDWETDVCHQPMPWDRYVGERPEGEFEFRVHVKLDNYYAHEFADEEAFRCLRLTALGSDEHLFGFVERGSSLDRELLEVLAGEKPVPNKGLKELERLARGRREPMILRLRFGPGSIAHRSVVISELISKRWCRVGGQAG